MTSKAFADHHDQLVGLAKGIVATVTTGSSDALQHLPAQRMALSKMVNRHCGEEIALINARARELQSDPTKAALIRRSDVRCQRSGRAAFSARQRAVRVHPRTGGGGA